MRSKSKVLFIVEVALFSALASILDLFSFKAWGQGGSISLQMVPIFIMSFRWGWRGGLSTGLVFGLLQLITGYVINPIQGLLDYPIAFTLVGLSAITAKSVYKSAKQKNKFRMFSFITLGCFVGSFARLIIHIISAMIYFGAGAPKNQAVWVYAIIYNTSYVFPSFVFSVILISILVQAREEIIFYRV
ncbi:MULTISPECIES: energy-coupled thiamine transporter ThiT [Clostridium]|jgi:thiamine transporter|uniref:Energy-coupled thiamine transporter ThiT n=1 Tax=Clostridium lapidicellarium TaxID=3240931 RepID=A0ABV4DZD8_9CLOT|nr:energy-coupled thiamine transporter ThiT [uncultured Clostridium sp.]NLU08481.1 energy-coupled thiamine transporter ThiT [Clostridiales bacterium]